MWRLWIDTGGTFTDCLALDPSGELHRAKVLSSSGIRGSVIEGVGRRPVRQVRLDLGAALPGGFLVGARLHQLGSDGGAEVESSTAEGAVRLTKDLEWAFQAGDRVEMSFDEEAPILAARLVTGSARVEDLPPLELRLATTRGTNALLERRGARTVFLVTKGFGDLLRIGDQRRPDLFALRIDQPEPLYERALEVDERLAADGETVAPLDLEALRSLIEGLRDEGFESAAVALLHSYLRDDHERRVDEALRAAGFEHVSRSAELSPSIKILPRAQTAVVDAYLAPVVGRYLEGVRRALGRDRGGGGGRRLRVMTSAGGLASGDHFRAKDSLLSGPAGGVVGAARVGRELGLSRLVAFDMGGTSTDVSRFDGDFDYRYEQRVGDAQIAAPALAIETVAAGGGSVCDVDGLRLTVGPQSAGASPGPACYGAGGPLTLTDVNLLLGRLDAQRFGIPVDESAAAAARDEILDTLRARGSDVAPDDLLRGFLEIADLRMAGAVRRISVRQGYDPRDFALVAFGGAGGQHACAVADELGIRAAVLPREAGLLSALGLGSARVERFAQRQVLRPLDESANLGVLLDELSDAAMSELAEEGVDEGDREVRRRIAFLRFAGQDATLEVEIGGEIGARLGNGEDAGSLAKALEADFHRSYEQRFGYRPDERPIEVESLRVVASTREDSETEDSETAGEAEDAATEFDTDFAGWDALPAAEPVATRRVAFDRWRDLPVFELATLQAGRRVDGPALIFDAHASLTLAPGWRAVRSAVGSVVAQRMDGMGSTDGTDGPE